MWQQYLTQQPQAGRGCGKKRDEGGLYASCGVGEEGMPIEHFLLDPVRPRAWQRGYEIKPDSKNVFHLIIYIGQSGKEADDAGYPSVWDYVEETRVYGASRKLPRTILNNPDFYKLQKGVSNMILVHAKAIPLFDYQLNRDNRPLYGCKLFQDFIDHKEQWEANLPHIAGFHNQTKTLWNKKSMLTHQQRCTLALRDLAYFSRDWSDEENIIEPVERDWQRFVAKGPSYSFTGNIPKLPELGIDLNWNSGAFLALPFHFEIPHEDKHNLADKLAQAGFEANIVDW